MTDRINAFTVVLGEDVRADDIDAIQTALGQIRGVIEVVPNVHTGLDEYVGRSRMRTEISSKLLTLLRDLD